jgi:hypothetical protein
MEQVLCEPVELTELELDAVAGGNPFSINLTALNSDVDARVRADIDNASSVTAAVTVFSGVNITGP